MRVWLLSAALATGCLDSPPGGVAADARPADAAPIDCLCPAEPCPFGFVRELRVLGDRVAEELAQLPVLVELDVSLHMAADGSDLRFATPDGQLLPHEVEDFPLEGRAAIWLGVGAVAPGTDTPICLFYGAGDPGPVAGGAAIWDSSFVGVWHLRESGEGVAGEYADSTANGCNGTGGDGGSFAPPGSAEAQIGIGQSFNQNEAISFGTGEHLDIGGEAITIEAWAQVSELGPDFLALFGKEGYTSGYRIVLGPLGEVLFQLTYDERHMQTAAGVFTTDAWHYLAATYDGAAMRIYVDGALSKEKVEVGTIDINDVPLLAGESNNQYPLAGFLDELRLSTAARSAGWIATQWASMTGTLVEIGDEQAL